jgi:hypothetical protein
MAFIDYEMSKRALEQYYKEHPEERNKKPLTKEEYIEFMKKKGFHFAEGKP